jgi:hypothetical protein
LLDIIAWLLLLGYVIYDWNTVRTAWLPWAFVALTAVYAVWFYARMCRLMARRVLQRAVILLRDQHVPPASDDQSSTILAECIQSPTGRQIMVVLGTQGTEPGQVQWSAEAMSVLTAFAIVKRDLGAAAEIDANTLRWLQPASFPSWEWFRKRFSRALAGGLTARKNGDH